MLSCQTPELPSSDLQHGTDQPAVFLKEHPSVWPTTVPQAYALSEIYCLREIVLTVYCQFSIGFMLFPDFLKIVHP